MKKQLKKNKKIEKTESLGAGLQELSLEEAEGIVGGNGRDFPIFGVDSLQTQQNLLSLLSPPVEHCGCYAPSIP